jgi:hypothetical protein
VLVLAAMVGCLSICSGTVKAQDLQTGNKYVVAHVLNDGGTIFIQVAPGRIGTDGQLNFLNKSYFSCKVGPTVYTNNNVLAPIPANTKILSSPDTLYKIVDTCYFVWRKRNGVDIIQEVWPVIVGNLFPTGQIVMRWKFKPNDTSQFITCAAQWLNDIDIGDPTDKRTFHVSSPVSFTQVNATDGPIVLLPQGYNSAGTYQAMWQQYPGSVSPTIPWFYDCPLFPLPGPSGGGGPGLSGFGYLDYPYPPINTIRPTYVTIGDWYTMAQMNFGHQSAGTWKMGSATGPDDAVLIEFAPVAVGGTSRVVVAGVTSYGLLPLYECYGTMYGLLTYNPHITWSKQTHTYSPTPDTAILYAVNPGFNGSANNSFYTLTGGLNLTVTANPAAIPYKQFSTQPIAPSSGFAMAPGNVQEIDWFLKVDPPVYFCNSDFISSVKISGTDGNSSLSPAYTRPTDGTDTCEHPIFIGCAETDTLPPRITSLTGTTFTVDFDVSDNRTTPIIDRGLKSITWNFAKGTPSTTQFRYTIKIDTDVVPLKPCYGDFNYHHISVVQKDSTVPACIDFQFIDCIGNEKDTEICFIAHIPPELKDTLPPRTADDTVADCHLQKRSVRALEIRPLDKGIGDISKLPGDSNMTLTVSPFKVGDPHVGFEVDVVDSEKDGELCVHIIDAASPPNHLDTCYYYCTTPDKLAPRISINQVGSNRWDVLVRDDTAWDRRINQIWVTGTTGNLTFSAPFTNPYGGAYNQTSFSFTIFRKDTTQSASFCVHANDRAANVDSLCAGAGTEKDALAPNIVPSKDPKLNPTDLDIGVNDIHYQNGIKYVWDTGLDSVWILYNTGYVTSWGAATVKAFHCDSVGLPVLHVTVFDSLAAMDTPACIGIRAKDCAGNISTWELCYPYAPDTLPPLMKVQYLDKQNIQVNITDNQRYDRGLGTILSSNELNIDKVNTSLQRIPTTQFIVKRQNLDQSTTATISAVDYWGSVFLNQALQHSAIAPVTVWIQDLAMPHGILTKQNVMFGVPVYFVKNDATPVDQKGITSIKFSFTMTGTPSALTVNNITFQNPKTLVNTPLATGWTVQPPTQVGNTITIMATANPGVVLKHGTDDTLMYINFTSTANNTTVNVTFEITPINTSLGTSESVEYNNSQIVTTNGLNSVSIMPPPWGSINGTNIVILGACTPEITNKAKAANSISLDEPNPNPVIHSTLMHYSVSDETDVRISIFDMLGRRVKELVAATVKPGTYDLPVDVRDMADGQYTIRMESAGSVVARKISVQK